MVARRGRSAGMSESVVLSIHFQSPLAPRLSLYFTTATCTHMSSSDDDEDSKQTPYDDWANALAALRDATDDIEDHKISVSDETLDEIRNLSRRNYEVLKNPLFRRLEKEWLNHDKFDKPVSVKLNPKSPKVSLVKLVKEALKSVDSAQAVILRRAREMIPDIDTRWGNFDVRAELRTFLSYGVSDRDLASGDREVDADSSSESRLSRDALAACSNVAVSSAIKSLLATRPDSRYSRNLLCPPTDETFECAVRTFRSFDRLIPGFPEDEFKRVFDALQSPPAGVDMVVHSIASQLRAARVLTRSMLLVYRDACEFIDTSRVLSVLDGVKMDIADLRNAMVDGSIDEKTAEQVERVLAVYDKAFAAVSQPLQEHSELLRRMKIRCGYLESFVSILETVELPTDVSLAEIEDKGLCHRIWSGVWDHNRPAAIVDILRNCAMQEAEVGIGTKGVLSSAQRMVDDALLTYHRRVLDARKALVVLSFVVAWSQTSPDELGALLPLMQRVARTSIGKYEESLSARTVSLFDFGST